MIGGIIFVLGSYVPFLCHRFHVELHFSPGVNCCVQKNLPPGPGFRPHSRNESVGSKTVVCMIS